MKLILIGLLFIANSVFAQSAFRRVPKPHTTNAMGKSVFSNNAVVKAFRFTGPIAGFMYPQNQVVTGLGYGFQRMHFVDSTQKYYTDFSISAVVFAGGNVRPSLYPNNIISFGVGLGILNQLFEIVPCYNLPATGHSGGSVGIVFSVSMPLNN